MRAAVRLRDITLGYPGHVLFRRLTIDMHASETLAIVGANGSGKSTFVKMLLGLVPPLSGAVQWVGDRKPRIGYLAQLTEFDRRFPIRVRDLVAMGAWGGFGLTAGLGLAGRRKVEAALDEVGVLDQADQPLHKLSGGQLQRALFARVMLQDAPVILLDEPFSAVDQSTEAHLLTIIQKWRTEGRAIALVVHDLSSVLDHCDRALLLGMGEAHHGPVKDVLTSDRLVAQGYLSESQAAWMFRAHAAEAEHV